MAFESNASNLVSGDGNGLSDVFLRDLNSRATVKVSGGAGPARERRQPPPRRLPRKGRYVAFASAATNLIAGDTNGQRDVFRWRRSSGDTILAPASTPTASQGKISAARFHRSRMTANGLVSLLSPTTGVSARVRGPASTFRSLSGPCQPVCWRSPPTGVCSGRIPTIWTRGWSYPEMARGSCVAWSRRRDLQ